MIIDWPTILEVFREGGYSSKKEFYNTELFKKLCGGVRPPLTQFYEGKPPIAFGTLAKLISG